MRSRSFLGHAAVYGLGNIFLQAAGLVLLPIYLRQLSVADYGSLEVINRVADVIAIALLTNGARQTTLAFYGRAKDDEERRAVTTTVIALVAAFGLAGYALFSLVAGPLSSYLSVDRPAMLRLALFGVLMDSFVAVGLALAQARVRSRFYVAITCGQFVVKVGLSVLLVLGLRWGLWGILSASALTSGLFGLALCAREIARAGLAVDRAMLRGMVRFALPFLPGGLCFFVMHSGDRFFLLRYVGQEGIGLYALGYRLATAVGLLSCIPLQMVWSATMYRKAREPDASAHFGRVLTGILGAYLAGGLGLCIFQDEVVALLGGSRYQEASLIIAPVVLAYFFLTAADLLDAAFYVCHRTDVKLWITMASTAVTLALYATLIPLYGLLGGALATLSAFVFHAGVTAWSAQRVFPIHIEFGRLASMLGLAALAWTVSRFVHGPWAVPARALIWALWPLTLWLCGCISPQEKMQIRSALAASSAG